ncbi:MAG TPA: ribbon-helix-helix domain-containing protein [Syntrophorhabdus sp.]|jgi:metal-responsive CopG/Arc/MetJ family transcriptional regulator|nr:ribbon-helix-helix domain-containing protein [Syntrophorhabdus sp.]
MVAKTAKGNVTRKTYSVKLDPQLVIEVKVRAAREETSISDIIEQALKAFLAKKR